MRILQCLSVLVFLFSSISSLSAAGATEEKDYEKVEGLQNWNKTLDLSQKKPGLYNIMLRGKDAAGNISYEGPINILIDPASDLPIVTINNPLFGLRVGGDLNVVGTAVDDDGIAKIEIAIDSGEFATANGLAFWNKVIDGRQLPDGPHTIRVRATDIHGLVGKEATTSFNLDKNKPRNSIASMAQGTLVSGRIELSGTVFDENGIETFSVSSDGGKTFETINTNFDQKNNTNTFSYQIDTTRYKDGPQILWLRSVDKTKSVGASAFLFFVDNTPPSLSFISPTEKQGVQGRTLVVGKALDALGIKSLSYVLNQKQVDLTYTPGDLYFSTFIDLPTTGNQLEIPFTAIDNSGNKTQVNLKLAIDPEADLPKVSLVYPAEGQVISSQSPQGLGLFGFATDDDGIKSLAWTIDSAKEVVSDLGYTFYIPLTDLGPGEQTLSYQGIDNFGTRGKLEKRKFKVPQISTSISISEVEVDGQKSKFNTGFTIQRDKKNTLYGSLLTNGPIAKGTITFGSLKPLALTLIKGGSDTSTNYSVLVPKDIDYGLVRVIIEVEDGQKNSSSQDFLLYVKNYTKANEPTGFITYEGLISAQGVLSLGADGQKVIGFAGETLASVALNPPVPGLELSQSENLVTIKANKEVVSPKTKIKATTTKGHIFETPELIIASDKTPPKISLKSPQSAFYAKDVYKLSSDIADGVGIKAVEFSLDEQKTWVSILPKGQENRTTLSLIQDIKLENPKGVTRIFVRAIDLEGNIGSVTINGVFDAQVPQVSILSFNSKPDASVGLLSVEVKEDWLKTLSLSYDQKTYEPMILASQSFALVDFKKLQTQSVWVKAVDQSGNEGQLEVKIEKPKDLILKSNQIFDPALERNKSQEGGGVIFNATDALGALSYLSKQEDLPAPSDQVRVGFLGPIPKTDIDGQIAFGFFAQGSLSKPGDTKTDLVSVEYQIDDGPALKLGALEFGSAIVSVKDLTKGSHKLSLRALSSKASSETVSFDFVVEGLVLQGQALYGPWTQGPIKGKIDGLPSDKTWSLWASGKKIKDINPNQTIDFGTEANPNLYVLKGQAKDGSYSLIGIPLSPLKAPSAIIALNKGQKEFEGEVFVSGSVTSQIPLKTLTLGGQTLSFERGQTEWFARIDVNNFKDGQIIANFETVIGQKFNTNVKVGVQKKIDDPVISFGTIDFKLAFAQGDFITGQVMDDDGLSSIIYSFDGQEKTELAPSNSFAIALPQAPGKHSLDLQARDSKGTITKNPPINFFIKGDAPLLTNLTLVDQRASLNYAPGILLGEDKNALGATIQSANTIAKVELKIDGGNFAPVQVKSDAKGTNIQVPLPKDLSFGRHDLILRAFDQFGQEKTETLVFFKVDLSFKGQINDESALIVKDEKIDQGQLKIKAGDSFVIFANARPIQKVDFEPKTNAFAAEVNGQYITITAKEEGAIPKLSIKVTTVDNDVLVLEPSLAVSVDGKAPEITFAENSDEKWIKDSLPLSLSLFDNGEVKSLFYYLDGSSEKKSLAFQAGKKGVSQPSQTGQSSSNAGKPAILLNNTPTATNTAPVVQTKGFYYSDLSLDLKDISEGGHVIFFEAVDDGGNIARASLKFQVDRTQPTIVFATPLIEDKVNGIFTLSATIADQGQLSQIAWSTDGKQFNDLPTESLLAQSVDLSKLSVVPEAFIYRITDKSGNVLEAQAPVQFDPEADKPLIQIQLPLEDEVIRQDFVISGMAFDDDKIDHIYYRLDPKKDADQFIELDGASNFSIPMNMLEVGDNEHLVEFYAVDMYGKKGDIFTRKFKISTEEPRAELSSPSIDLTNRGIVVLKGSATDKNNIKEIWVSLNNGLSFSKASDGPSFEYAFDSSLIEDGIIAVQIKSIDNYGTEGLYATICNIDNTLPESVIDFPANGEEVSGALHLDGRANDNIVLDKLEYVISQLDDQNKVKAEVMRGLIPSRGPFSENIDVSKLAVGWYNVRIEAQDKAHNFGYASKNFKIVTALAADSVDILYPLSGSKITGMFRVEGRLNAQKLPEQISIYNGDLSLGDVKLDSAGYFSLLLGPGSVNTGSLKLLAKSGTLSSKPIEISYNEEGPYTLVETVHLGSFVRNRPFIEGKSGWYLWPLSDEEKKDEKIVKQRQLLQESSAVEKVEFSYDNGRSFSLAQGTNEWKFRFESLLIADGPIYVTIKTTYKDGSFSSVQTRIQLDQTGPVLRILSPKEGGMFNEQISLKGIAKDNVELSSVDLVLRSGDKLSYELPSFIQGMYLDAHFLGATTWEAGLGFTFFDNNVRLQAQFGSAPEGRFEGQVLGAKLLANVFKLPFSSIFGPDAENLSMTLGVGAKFNFFTQSPDFDFSKGIGLGAVLVHWDLVRFKFGEGFFNSITAYSELEAWMVSADVSGGIFVRASFGALIGLF